MAPGPHFHWVSDTDLDLFVQRWEFECSRARQRKSICALSSRLLLRLSDADETLFLPPSAPAGSIPSHLAGDGVLQLLQPTVSSVCRLLDDGLPLSSFSGDCLDGCVFDGRLPCSCCIQSLLPYNRESSSSASRTLGENAVALALTTLKAFESAAFGTPCQDFSAV